MNSMNDLTRQERTVLSLLAMGRRNANIANELSISTRTVENHMYHIFDKLGVSSRTEAAIYALNTGMVGSGEMSSFSHD